MLKKHSIITASMVTMLSLLSVQVATVQDAFASETITITYPYDSFIGVFDGSSSISGEPQIKTDTAEYSDGYFDKESAGVHPELRAVSYALALAGFENEASGYPSGGEGPNPRLRELLVNQMGFSNFQAWDTASEADGHSMGTSIARKTLESGKELVVVVPRSYDYFAEWVSNLDVGESGDHAGFTEAAGLMYDRVKQYLSSQNITDYKLWIVGYSRGGAVVDLLAKKINENLGEFGLPADDLYAYTFGAPRASVTETRYGNIHDVKDGNDLLLGYVFPEAWGFYNTGVYEEVHPADFKVDGAMIDTTEIIDSSVVMSLITRALFGEDVKLLVDGGERDGKEFVDEGINFVISNGMTREYYNSTVKEPLSKLMKLYQGRPIDEQGEFISYVASMNSNGEVGINNPGILAMILRNLMMDFGGTYGAVVEDYPVYLDIVSILDGTATSAEIDELATFLGNYIGVYDDYEPAFEVVPPITRDEFNTLKDNAVELVRVLAPFIVADARYTLETYGENRSLYYTVTLISNIKKLLYGHIPESLMPILKSYESESGILAPDSGAMTGSTNAREDRAIVMVGVVTAVVFVAVRRRRDEY